MSLILNIDTTNEHAFIAIARDGKLIARADNHELKNHAAWLHIAIQNLFDEQKIKLNELKAIAVSNGPGSYTGLRVGLSAAKGICYAQKIPLILLDTLELIARSGAENSDAEIIVPMIDARRMEVFTAVYDREINCLEKAKTLILDEQSFSHYAGQKILFIGNGAEKWEAFLKSKNDVKNTGENNEILPNFLLKIDAKKNAFFFNNPDYCKEMTKLSFNYLVSCKFNDVAYSTPNYIKEFYTNSN